MQFQFVPSLTSYLVLATSLQLQSIFNLILMYGLLHISYMYRYPTPSLFP